MATSSRYADEEQSAGNTAPPLNPNTQQSTSQGESAQTSTSTSSSYAGLTAKGLADTQQIIDKLLYGSQPKKEPIYVDEKGQEHSLSTYVAKYGAEAGQAAFNTFLHELRAIPGAPGLMENNTLKGGRYTVKERITPSEDSVLNVDPQKARALTDIRNLLSSYSPDRASQDAQTAVNYSIQKAMEANMPAIQRSVENAGTSGGSMSALLSQDLAARAAGEAATLSLQNKQKYGDISTQLSSVLSNLVSQEDPRLKQLLQALDTTRSQSSSSSQTSSSTSSQSSQQGPIGMGGDLPGSLLESSPSSSASDYTPPSYEVRSSRGSRVQNNSGMSQGSGFISSSNGLTLFGETTADQAIDYLRNQ